MNSLRRLRWILKPSLLSGLAAVLLTFLVMGSAGWSYVSDVGLFYEQLFGALGVVTILQLQPNVLLGLQNTIFNGPLTYYVLLVAGALIAGLSIYLILESISLVVHGASLFIREVHADRKAARDAAKRTLVRLILQVTGLVAWAIYWLVFANVLVPFGIVMLQQALDAISDGAAVGWLVLPVVFMWLAVSTHLHATFARLVFLRVRLLGGLDAEMSRIEAESQHTQL